MRSSNEANTSRAFGTFIDAKHSCIILAQAQHSLRVFKQIVQAPHRFRERSTKYTSDPPLTGAAASIIAYPLHPASLLACYRSPSVSTFPSNHRLLIQDLSPQSSIASISGSRARQLDRITSSHVLDQYIVCIVTRFPRDYMLQAPPALWTRAFRLQFHSPLLHSRNKILSLPRMKRK